MPGKIVIIGAGFAGLYSALAAKNLVNVKNSGDGVEVVVIAPEASLVLRPRLYEADAGSMFHPLDALFKDAGITFVAGSVRSIQTESQTATVVSASGAESTVGYDRLVLAAGSALARPRAVAGLEEHAFDIDTLSAAARLEAHIKRLDTLPVSAGRDTIVVCGAGFTGVELAAELPARLSHLPGARVVLVENAHVLGPELGPGPRPVITEALQDLGVEVKLGSAVTSVEANGVTLASGEFIPSKTTVWSAGMRATPLTLQIDGPKDGLGRLHVDQHLRVPSSDKVFATGDAALAAADDLGHYALMSCQHALALGRVSGYNAAADLLGEPPLPYSQPVYGCCLDLGGWGAVVTAGWERKVDLTRADAKKFKCYVNQKLIYPPTDVAAAFKDADPTLQAPDAALQEVTTSVR